MSIVTATEVRYTGDWDSAQYSDGMLHSAAYIPAADAWLNSVCSTNGYSSGYNGTTMGATLGDQLKAIELYYAAALVTSIPPKDDFQAGPVRSTGVKGADKEKLVKNYWKLIKTGLNNISFVLSKWTFTSAGGADYHPSDADKTNVDFRYTDSKNAFDLGGGKQ